MLTCISKKQGYVEVVKSNKLKANSFKQKTYFYLIFSPLISISQSNCMFSITEKHLPTDNIQYLCTQLINYISIYNCFYCFYLVFLS